MVCKVEEARKSTTLQPPILFPSARAKEKETQRKEEQEGALEREEEEPELQREGPTGG